MARLTEEMVIARSKQSDLSAIKKLNCWGAELGDVSLLRRMPNVEVLALSINKIRSLGDFAGCRRLRELYVRKNEIRDLAEIRHLRHLPDLTSLWLDENPCTLHPEYRMTVLRNLPNLEKLDNVVVQPDEVQEAMRRGVHIPDSDDEGYPQTQESYGQYRRQRSCESSPERETEYYRQQQSQPPPRHQHPQAHAQGQRHEHWAQGSDSSAEPEPAVEPERSPPAQCPASPARPSPDDDRPETHYDVRGPRSPDTASLRHSMSAHSVKDYTYSSNGEWRQHGGGTTVTSPHDQDRDRSESYSVREWERDREASRDGRDRDREYPSAVMAEHRGFTRRPVARNSNLLSAVLCLVKELDYPSLEVAEMAVRCRMDELANSQ
ncbi:cilia- and flagella-associated protein 410 isoform X1 [Danaus plexippus]|uniref:cilia- and flagella-associated protein 410 isoform X1 n=1 Tax=Danaus plexippus TaxID=13037 RepID=UPI002AAF75F1|nr:cilia- and flagella-associated protein 410 isoform X1 [Danaus plexippus]